MCHQKLYLILQILIIYILKAKMLIKMKCIALISNKLISQDLSEHLSVLMIN